MRVKSFVNKGNSFPIILEDNEKTYFVKLRAGMSGKYGMITDWIGNKIGQQLNLNTQTPFWIELNLDVEMDEIYVEVKELISKSYGINIGFPYHSTAKDIYADDLKLQDRSALNEIYLFDLMMINVDRTSSNLNMMKIDSELIPVDYESSLILTDLIEQKYLLSDIRVLQCLRNNPLYEQIDETLIEGFLAKIKTVDVSKIIKEIPTTLMSQEERNLFIEAFEAKHHNKWFINETMLKLKKMKPEREIEQKIRAKNNQALFKRNFKRHNS